MAADCRGRTPPAQEPRQAQQQPTGGGFGELLRSESQTVLVPTSHAAGGGASSSAGLAAPEPAAGAAPTTEAAAQKEMVETAMNVAGMSASDAMQAIARHGTVETALEAQFNPPVANRSRKKRAAPAAASAAGQGGAPAAAAAAGKAGGRPKRRRNAGGGSSSARSLSPERLQPAASPEELERQAHERARRSLVSERFRRSHEEARELQPPKPPNERAADGALVRRLRDKIEPDDVGETKAMVAAACWRWENNRPKPPVPAAANGERATAEGDAPRSCPCGCGSTYTNTSTAEADLSFAMADYDQRLDALRARGGIEQKPVADAIKSLFPMRDYKWSAAHFGAIPGIRPETFFTAKKHANCFTSMSEMRGITCPKMWGPTLQQPATSIVMAGGYDDDDDRAGNAAEVWYTGQGGQDETGMQTSSQTCFGDNMGLLMNWKLKIPIRVFRKHEKDKKLGALDGGAKGFRVRAHHFNQKISYDGVYDIVEWKKVPSKHGPDIYQYKLERQAGQGGAVSAKVTTSAKIRSAMFGTEAANAEKMTRQFKEHNKQQYESRMARIEQRKEDLVNPDYSCLCRDNHGGDGDRSLAGLRQKPCSCEKIYKTPVINETKDGAVLPPELRYTAQVQPSEGARRLLEPSLGGEKFTIHDVFFKHKDKREPGFPLTAPLAQPLGEDSSPVDTPAVPESFKFGDCGCQNGCFWRNYGRTRRECEPNGFRVLYQSSGAVYDDDSRMRYWTDKVFECGPDCSCAGRTNPHDPSAPICKLRLAGEKRSSAGLKPFEVFRTKPAAGRAHSGWGVKSPHMILIGEFLAEYTGELITREEEQSRGSEYALGLSVQHKGLTEDTGTVFESPLTIDANALGNIGRFFNHSCNPNMYLVPVYVGDQDARTPKLCFFAQSDIEPGTELTWSYAQDADDDSAYPFTCGCGHDTCFEECKRMVCAEPGCEHESCGHGQPGAIYRQCQQQELFPDGAAAEGGGGAASSADAGPSAPAAPPWDTQLVDDKVYSVGFEPDRAAQRTSTETLQFRYRRDKDKLCPDIGAAQTAGASAAAAAAAAGIGVGRGDGAGSKPPPAAEEAGMAAAADSGSGSGSGFGSGSSSAFSAGAQHASSSSQKAAAPAAAPDAMFTDCADAQLEHGSSDSDSDSEPYDFTPSQASAPPHADAASQQQQQGAMEGVTQELAQSGEPRIQFLTQGLSLVDEAQLSAVSTPVTR